MKNKNKELEVRNILPRCPYFLMKWNILYSVEWPRSWPHPWAFRFQNYPISYVSTLEGSNSQRIHSPEIVISLLLFHPIIPTEDPFYFLYYVSHHLYVSPRNPQNTFLLSFASSHYRKGCEKLKAKFAVSKGQNQNRKNLKNRGIWCRVF